MFNPSFIKKHKKPDKFEPLPLYIDLPLPELKPIEKDKENESHVIIIELF